MDRVQKIEILQFIEQGKLNPKDYTDLPCRVFTAASQHKGFEAEQGIFFYQIYKYKQTGEVLTDVELTEIIQPYAACLPANSLYWATAAFFGIGIGEVKLPKLTKVEQLASAATKFKDAN